MVFLSSGTQDNYVLELLAELLPNKKLNIMGFLSREKKSMAFLDWFFNLYIRSDLSKILEEHCCNSFRHFWRITSEDNISWCGVSGGLFARLSIGRATIIAADRTTIRAAAGAAAGAAGDGACFSTGRATNRIASCGTDGTAGRAADDGAGRAVSSVASSRAASGSTGRTVGDGKILST